MSLFVLGLPMLYTTVLIPLPCSASLSCLGIEQLSARAILSSIAVVDRKVLFQRGFCRQSRLPTLAWDRRSQLYISRLVSAGEIDIPSFVFFLACSKAALQKGCFGS
jgi:hypothetical protein